MMRPRPPFEMVDSLGEFRPAPELEAWARATFIADTATLSNPDHAHLQMASLGFVWTNEPNTRAGRVILGQCEKMPPMAMGKWQRARVLAQITDWFGQVPDFLITISAGASQYMDNDSFCALIEHELYHAGQDTDAFGQPKFKKDTGLPVFAIKGHDVEEFVGVVRRYGASAAGVEEMVRAANKGPEIGAAAMARACGNCLRLVG
jgi:hypothetical protein